METTNGGSRGYLVSIVMVAVLGGLLFGYDTAVISGAEKGLQAFFMGATDFTYTDFWHGFTSSSALIGCIIGSALSGVLATGLGRKRTLILAGIMFFISAWGSMCPESMILPVGKPDLTLLVVFNIYRIIGGVGVGLASAVCPMYIGEIAPSRIRGMLVSWNQFAIIFGQLVVYFVNFFILGDHIAPLIQSVGSGMNEIVNGTEAAWAIETGWRYMFGSEMVPAGLFAVLICLVPETPRYLVMVGKDDKAERVLARINGADEARRVLADIKNTVTQKTERIFTYGVMCIVVGVMLSVFQQAIGINAVLYYAPRIYEAMGFDNPMKLTVFNGVLNLGFTCVAIFTVEKLGRKPLLIAGSLGMALGAIGVAFTFGVAELKLLCMISIMLYSVSFMYSWGPICWVLIAEVFPNTIRGAAVAIAVAFQWIFNWIVSTSFVPMANSMGYMFTYSLYGVICILAAVFVWRLVPETKGKTLEDMSRLWRKEK
ncbi:d-xylose-proton symporter [Prevotella sp. CAG:474]|uniref:D-xylose transporter XylE n=1 Tax=Prevotella TaxID=838 RepID=UPI000338E389|nr:MULTISPECIES: D-xylose transporter XylE [Prevotella]MEE0619901.1 D-xylose transporter XylE [Prevotella sp.]CDD00685.1 d-xylose-proton symporter [Prevotella sp. CAG:474]MCF2637021.1 D-xylose transporter XylE [Prevotella dentalis]OYP70204.1 D-xylose transporter XylE [Prevotella sp. P5-64]OYP76083.1 D-xylose transporter XylE [Prevotella sp. P4-51]